MLIINALSGAKTRLNNLSESDDTAVLKHALNEKAGVMDVGHAGTAMRFLTAYLATTSGEVLLTGSQRMKERPIGPLVDALRQLGAKIEYEETEGCPPLKISGGSIRGGALNIEAGISSQFISALMMIGPVLEGGLEITLKGEVVSSTYIGMTLALMNQCGASATFDGRQILVPPGSYGMKEFTVESDWSGASYWYQVAAMLPGSGIELPHLTDNSLQGDAALTFLFEPLGVRSNFRVGGVFLDSEQKSQQTKMEYDFTGCPDLVQTCVVTLCSMGVPFLFTGTRTLRVKETDRIMALETELKKVGFILDSDREGAWIRWDGKRCEPESDPVIKTYHDHRMAMSFAPLAIALGSITIDDPEVVTKSYPGYWKDLEKAGFRIDVSGKTG